MNEKINDDAPLSRTRKKKLAKEIEQMAKVLVEMPENQFSRLSLQNDLAEEVRLARATVGRSSHKRQTKHLAGLLRKREKELQQLMQQIQEMDQVSRCDRSAFHQLEALRDRLCEAASFDNAYNDMLRDYPQIDHKAIARLARSVHQHQDKRASREIFKRLRDAVERS